MGKLSRVLSTGSGLTLLMSGVSFMAPAPASASVSSSASIKCGAMITTNTVLTANIGPCLNGNGLNVKANNITIDLNGHKVTGSHGSVPLATKEQVGINLDHVSHVTLQHGTVDLFDAGVTIHGGSHNTVSHVAAKKNVNVNLLEPTVTTSCNFGDGIVADASNYNLITHDSASGDGPYDGITLVNASSHNMISHNIALNNDVINFTRQGKLTNCGSGFSRPIQDIGIRIEGPGAKHNSVVDNTVTNSGLDGIGILSNFCGTPGHKGDPNTNNLIENNTVTRTGSNPAVNKLDAHGTGIAVLQQGPAGIVCSAYNNSIIGNISSDNFGNGISLAAPNSGDTFVGNITDNNGRNGIFVQGPEKAPTYGGALDTLFANNVSHQNAIFDAADFNDQCSAPAVPPVFPANSSPNRWQSNDFGTVNQPCVANADSGIVTSLLLQNYQYAGPIVSVVDSPPGLSTPWTDDVTVVNAQGFILYKDTACTSPIGAGTGVATGNDTFSPTISFNNVTGGVAYTIAAGSVQGTNTANNPVVPNAAIPCTAVGSVNSVPGL